MKKISLVLALLTICLFPFATQAAQTVENYETNAPVIGDSVLDRLGKLLILDNAGIIIGGITDAEIRATPLPVSISNWPGTQAVSLASVPLPTGAATEATLALIKTSLISPAKFFSVTATASGNTAVWTPASGKKFRLMRFLIVATADTTSATASITVKLNDGASTNTGLSVPMTVPTIAPTVAAISNTSLTPGWVDLGTGYLSTTADNVLNINLSAALTAGKVGIIVCGTEE